MNTHQDHDHHVRAHYAQRSRLASFSPLGAPARRLPAYGAERETIGVTARRFDVDDRTSRDLEREADALLRADGFPVDRVDVIDMWTRLPEIAPDRVAFRGQARFRPHACHVSERSVTGPRTIVRADGTTQQRKGTERTLVDTGTPGTEVPVVLARTTIKRADGSRVVLIGCTGRGWHGRRIVLTPKVTRRDESGRAVIGRPVGSIWTVDASNVRRRWVKATADQQARAIALRTALVTDGSLVLSGVTLVLDVDASVSVPTTDRTKVRALVDGADAPRGESFALVDAVRRAALSR